MNCQATRPDRAPRVIAHSNAIASGLMLGACFGLVTQGTRYGSSQTIAGGILGVVFILVPQRWLERHDIQIGQARGAGARRMLLMVVVMTVLSVLMWWTLMRGISKAAYKSDKGYAKGYVG